MDETLQKLMRELWNDGVMFSGSVIERLKRSVQNGITEREKLHDIPGTELCARVTVKIEKGQ